MSEKKESRFEEALSSQEPTSAPRSAFADNGFGHAEENVQENRSFGANSIPSGVKRQPVEKGSFSEIKASIPQAEKKTSTSTDYKEQSVQIVKTVFIDAAFEKYRAIVLCLIGIPLLLFAQFPAWANLEHVWRTTLDYSHGYLVIPLVMYFLYIRIDRYPGTNYSLCYWGLIPIGLASLARIIGSWYFMDAVENWSILLWILGYLWLFYGTRAFVWAMPSLLFLVFLFPLPDRFDVALRNQLQPFAAQSAAYLLQLIGEPAIAFQTTVLHGDRELSVEAACSGLRFIISISAIAYGSVLLFRKNWIQNVLLLASAVPIALFVNASRIALTGLFLQYFPDMLAKHVRPGLSESGVADKIAGFVMIFVALAIFATFLMYLNKVFRPVSIVDIDKERSGF